MTEPEKQALLGLLDTPDHWCKDLEARKADGTGTSFDAEDAVAWDLTGALCRLFGWNRARVLFGQFDRHIRGRRVAVLLSRDDGIRAMVALQTFNDHPDRTFSQIQGAIVSMPIWSSGARTNSAPKE